jgi:hypothetical protein
MADVNIKIDIDADTSAIDRVRAKLRSLCKEVDDCTGTIDKHTKSLKDLSDAQDKTGRGSGKNGNAFNKAGKASKSLTGFLAKLAKFGFMYLAVEAAAALLVIASAGILFKSGQILAKAYEMSLSGVAYGFAAIVAAGSAALAAMRQFQAVQFAPSFSEGTINTDDPMRAASASMKMFIDDQAMAVIGTKGLTAAFKTLNDQQQITGETTAVFRQLSNYTAGMGGDMEKGSQAMAKFLAQFQKDKRMTEAVKEAGKELGPGFKKILNEANKLGLNTYEKFTKAALEGELGETFAKYSGQLNAVNSTVIGQFKQGFASIKNILVEVGEPLLGPLTKQIPRVVNILKGLILTIRGNVEAIGKGSALDGLVNGFEKIALWIGKIVNRDIGKAGDSLNTIVNGWRSMMSFFEKIQDYLRPLLPASYALGRIAKELLSVFGGSIDGKIQKFSDAIIENEQKLKDFVRGFGDLLTGFGEFGNAVTSIIGTLLPGLSKLLTLMGDIFSFLAKLLVPLNKIVGIIMWLAKGLDAILNPILTVVDKITFGVVSFRDVVQSLTAAVLAFAAAMLVSSKARAAGKGFFSRAADDAMDMGGGGKKGKFGKFLGRTAKGGAKAGGRGIMSLGRGAVSMGGKLAAKFGATGGAAGGGAATAATALGGLAIVGGSAYGGSKAGGFVSDKLFNDDSVMSKTGGALTGAAAGAGTGALVGAGIGSLFGGVGAAPGAAIGAVVGAVFGGISGWVSAGKEKKAARKAAEDILKNFGTELDSAIKDGDTQGIADAAAKMNKELLELSGSNKYGSKEVKRREAEIKAAMKQAENASSNFSAFESIFGDPDQLMSELEKQGKSADLVKNGIIDIFQIMRDGGHDVAATWSSVMSEFNQKLLTARLAMFQLPLQTIAMQEKVNAAQQRVMEGDTSEQSIISFLQDAFEYSMNLSQGDVTKGTIHFQKTIEKVSGPGGSMNKVADKLMEQADKLNLFDPQVFADQLIASGQTEVQGRALAALTGQDSALATVEINRRLQAGGAEESDRINKLLQYGTAGRLDGDELMMAMSGDTVMMESMLEKARLREAYSHSRAGNMHGGEGGVAAPNSNPVNVGGVTVNVAGFITDDKTAKRIAQMVQAEVARQRARTGRAGS